MHFKNCVTSTRNREIFGTRETGKVNGGGKLLHTRTVLFPRFSAVVESQRTAV